VREPRTDRPSHTCPDIDGILADLERLRSANLDLRNNAEEWEELAREYFELAKEWEKYSEYLESQIERN
jgi:hypothetical protein